MRESIECLSATGEKMRLEVIEHGDAGSAKEFIVAAPKFNFKKWFSLTVALRSVIPGLPWYELTLYVCMHGRGGVHWAWGSTVNRDVST